MTLGRESVKNPLQRHQRPKHAHVKALSARVHVLDGVNDAAVLAEVTDALQELLVDHVEAARCTESQNHTQVEQVILLQLAYTVRVVLGLVRVGSLVQRRSTALVKKHGEFVLHVLLLALIILEALTQNGHEVGVLVERALRLRFHFQNVTEGGRKAYLATPIEDDLRAIYARVSHADVVERLKGPQNLSADVLQDALWQ